MSYDEFSRKAAHVSSRVVREMASRLAKERL
jgi:nucleoside phosphorylase